MDTILTALLLLTISFMAMGYTLIRFTVRDRIALVISAVFAVLVLLFLYANFTIDL
jgi:hypothetical protein